MTLRCNECLTERNEAGPWWILTDPDTDCDYRFDSALCLAIHVKRIVPPDDSAVTALHIRATDLEVALRALVSALSLNRVYSGADLYPEGSLLTAARAALNACSDA